MPTAVLPLKEPHPEPPVPSGYPLKVEREGAIRKQELLCWQGGHETLQEQINAHLLEAREREVRTSIELIAAGPSALTACCP